MLLLDPVLVGVAVAVYVFGGIMKGATGAGTPVLAVPATAALVDIQFAVVAFILPAILTNTWQAFNLRKQWLPPRFMVLFVGSGGLGVIAGTYALKELPADQLTLALAVVVVLYIAFRVTNRGWVLKYAPALRLSAPLGLIGGVLQGATGVSAPATVTFLNAMRLERLAFAGTISLFFLVLAVVQAYQVYVLGMFTQDRLILGVIATMAVFSGMWIGGILGRYMSKTVFDHALLGLLGVIAVKIFAEAAGVL